MKRIVRGCLPTSITSYLLLDRIGRLPEAPTIVSIKRRVNLGRQATTTIDRLQFISAGKRLIRSVEGDRAISANRKCGGVGGAGRIGVAFELTARLADAFLPPR